jgi:hypothetical protein
MEASPTSQRAAAWGGATVLSDPVSQGGQVMYFFFMLSENCCPNIKPLHLTLHALLFTDSCLP